MVNTFCINVSIIKFIEELCPQFVCMKTKGKFQIVLLFQTKNRINLFYVIHKLKNTQHFIMILDRGKPLLLKKISNSILLLALERKSLCLFMKILEKNSSLSSLSSMIFISQIVSLAKISYSVRRTKEASCVIDGQFYRRIQNWNFQMMKNLILQNIKHQNLFTSFWLIVIDFRLPA